jgi:RimJ/RimL family protein N-acetyltransferase
VKLIPATLDMLAYTGLLQHEEAREFCQIWGGGQFAVLVLDDGKPIGIVALREQPDWKNCGWGNVWIVPEKRGHWLDDEAFNAIASFAFASYPQIAATTDNPVCGRFLRKHGFQMYCQRDGISYYSLIRKVSMSEPQ